MATKLRRTARQLWQTLGSIKTGVVLLILVVVISAAGTLILQRPVTDPDEMQRAYSPQVLRALDAVGLTDVFHAKWFVLLLALVSLSIIAASVERFPNAWRFFSRPYKSTDEAFRKALPTQKQIRIDDSETGLAAAEHVFRKFRLGPQRVDQPNQPALYGERNRISELAVYVVHASLLLIFVGGIVDALCGWRGYVALTPGEVVSQVPLREGGSRALPFSIRCDATGQENYQDGTPKRWWSKLAVVKDGRDVQRKEIVVNDPLVFGGIRFYQASYGPTGKLDKLVLKATRATGNDDAREIRLGVGESAQLDPDTSVELAEFFPDYFVRDGQVFNRSTGPDNPAAHLSVTSRRSSQTVNVWLPPIPGFAENSRSPYVFEAEDLTMGVFTGLQVSHEPGQWAVWAGVILMGIGLAMVFYIVHVRVWAVPVHDARGRLVLWVGGTANRNRDAFEAKFAALTDAIEKELQSELRACVPAHATSLAGD